jgi:copper chaperone
MTTTYIVDGMTCGHCAQAVTNALKSLDNAADIHVDLEKKTVRVTGLNDETAICEAIEDAGFDFKGKEK